MPGPGASGRLAVQDGVELIRPSAGGASGFGYVIAGGDGPRGLDRGAEDDAAAAVTAVEGLKLADTDVATRWRRRPGPPSPAPCSGARAAGR